MVQQRQYIEGLHDVQDPFFVQHEQREGDDAGHGWDVKKTGLVHTEKKEFQQQQPGAEVFVKFARTKLSDVQEPYAETAGRYQRDGPKLPRHNRRGQAQHSAEYRGDNSQQQMPACLFPRPHLFSSSCATRFFSSWGRQGFLR